MQLRQFYSRNWYFGALIMSTGEFNFEILLRFCFPFSYLFLHGLLQPAKSQEIVDAVLCPMQPGFEPTASSLQHKLLSSCSVKVVFGEIQYFPKSFFFSYFRTSSTMFSIRLHQAKCIPTVRCKAVGFKNYWVCRTKAPTGSSRL